MFLGAIHRSWNPEACWKSQPAPTQWLGQPHQPGIPLHLPSFYSVHPNLGDSTSPVSVVSEQASPSNSPGLVIEMTSGLPVFFLSCDPIANPLMPSGAQILHTPNWTTVYPSDVLGLFLVFVFVAVCVRLAENSNAWASLESQTCFWLISLLKLTKADVWHFGKYLECDLWAHHVSKP